MKRYKMQAVLPLLLLISGARAEEQPPFEIQDPAINENFRRIYQLLDSHNHDGVDSPRLRVVTSSQAPAQFEGYSMWTGSATLSGGASIVIAPPAVTTMFLPEAWELNSSSKTLKVEDWKSSFTVTNTGTITQRFGWRVLAK